MQPVDPAEVLLVQSASRGDRVAIEALLARFLPELRAFLRLRTGPRLLQQETPDDLVQSVCREVLEHAAGFDYRGEHAFKSWLFLTALHKVRDKGRYYAAEKRDAARQRPAQTDPGDCSGYASLLSPSRVAIGREEVGRALAFASLAAASTCTRRGADLPRRATLPAS